MYREFERICRDRGDVLAIAGPERSVTFSGLWADVEAIRRTLSPGMLVVGALPSGPELTSLHLAALGAEAAVLAVPPAMTAREVAELARLVWADRVIATADEPWSPLRADPSRDLRLPRVTRQIQLTSGSTSAPKALLFDEPAITAGVAASRPEPGTIAFCAAPQFHAMGHAVVFEHLFAGCTVVCADRFDPAAEVARLRAHRCTSLVANPGYLRLLCGFGLLSDLPDLREITLGAEATDDRLVQQIRERLPAVTLHVRYGVAEAFGALTRLTVGSRLLPGHVGRPVCGELTADDGELRVRTPSAAFAALGPDGPEALPPILATGDAARIDADGVTLIGRLGSFIKALGHRVSPFEVESVLRSIPGVTDAVVVGIPDPVGGERVAALIEGDRELAVSAILQACRRELAPYKVPRKVVLGAIPRTHSGKADRARAAAMLRHPA